MKSCTRNRKACNTSKNWIQRLSVFLRGVNSNNSMKSSSNLLMNHFLFKLSMSNSFEWLIHSSDELRSNILINFQLFLGMNIIEIKVM